jgi:hypothetical protein
MFAAFDCTDANDFDGELGTPFLAMVLPKRYQPFRDVGVELQRWSPRDTLSRMDA